jgi:hypothetical protein
VSGTGSTIDRVVKKLTYCEEYHMQTTRIGTQKPMSDEDELIINEYEGASIDNERKSAILKVAMYVTDEMNVKPEGPVKALHEFTPNDARDKMPATLRFLIQQIIMGKEGRNRMSKFREYNSNSYINSSDYGATEAKQIREYIA